MKAKGRWSSCGVGGAVCRLRGFVMRILRALVCLRLRATPPAGARAALGGEEERERHSAPARRGGRCGGGGGARRPRSRGWRLLARARRRARPRAAARARPRARRCQRARARCSAPRVRGARPCAAGRRGHDSDEAACAMSEEPSSPSGGADGEFKPRAARPVSLGFDAEAVGAPPQQARRERSSSGGGTERNDAPVQHATMDRAAEEADGEAQPRHEDDLFQDASESAPADAGGKKSGFGRRKTFAAVNAADDDTLGAQGRGAWQCWWWPYPRRHQKVKADDPEPVDPSCSQPSRGGSRTGDLGGTPSTPSRTPSTTTTYATSSRGPACRTPRSSPSRSPLSTTWHSRASSRSVEIKTPRGEDVDHSTLQPADALQALGHHRASPVD